MKDAVESAILFLTGQSTLSAPRSPFEPRSTLQAPNRVSRKIAARIEISGPLFPMQASGLRHISPLAALLRYRFTASVYHNIVRERPYIALPFLPKYHPYAVYPYYCSYRSERRSAKRHLGDSVRRDSDVSIWKLGNQRRRFRRPALGSSGQVKKVSLAAFRNLCDPNPRSGHLKLLR